ncbi:MAG: dgoA protein [Planctomycetota bacterium]|nr:MAG: dgoA protein [Planctomycetota bacterium]
MLDRRTFLAAGVSSACSLWDWGLGPRWTRGVVAAQSRAARRDFVIREIRRTTVKVPFREIPRRAMDRELPHWRYSEIVEVRLQSGHTGFGETLLYYTWGATGDDDVRRAQGRNALELLWDDSLGAGLQMALFDAVGRTAGVPVHALLGRRVHARTPLSWWNIDMPPEDMAAECQLAHSSGYRAYKTKGRPWFDLWEQVARSTAVVPRDFHIDMDFNDTLLDADRAIPILKELERYPQIDIYETPIPQSDVAGNKRIRQATRVKIAMHYGNPAPLVALREDVCDGFVVSGGAKRLLDIAAVCAMADKPFWLQLVGTTITAYWSLHFGAVCSHATWPAVNCHQLYRHSLTVEPISVRDGLAAVPDGPGLGVELDRDVIDRLRVEKPPQRPEPPRLIETSWPDGTRMYIANTGRVNFMLTIAQQGKMPFFTRGVTTRLVPDDGSERWRNLWERARKAPVIMKS